MYHIVDEPRSAREQRFCCLPRRFEAQMRFLRRSRITIMGLDEWIACRNGTTGPPERGVIVSFDDGFQDFYGNAFPVLQRYSIPAVLFVVSDLVGKSNEWMHRRGFPRREMLSWPQLRELKDGGITIGCHTRTHPRLPEIADEPSRLADEIGGARHVLQDALGTEVDYFAYPYGLFDDRVRSVVSEAGFKAACSVRAGFNQPDSDILSLRRLDVFGNDALWQFRQKIKFGRNAASRLFPLRYYGRRAATRFWRDG